LRPGSAESSLAVLAVASLIESTARIQLQTAEILRDLAARNEDDAVTRRFGGAADQTQWLSPAHDRPAAQFGRGQKRHRRPHVQLPPGCPAEPLTAREQAVLRLLMSQLSLREIGREISVSLNTVKSHTRAIYRKLGVSDRHHAVRRGRELALLPR
jgi:ATP/maltotriose-dependent transcriptional regulator MalT